ncbi:hypothetical protein FYK61_10045 [Xanthomonas citri]|uniref:hypothetical protein n=1 Tax=Xanthomonas citri TaxID=346 RepID=UPI001884DF33|nr:hypothetical protein [Xanthomonas citri]QOY21720.1 hypothetical protein FYK61_10045 [Xanthomonas citri]QQK67857.1 hypothetical protein G3566_10030 [Xanthomonas citri]
MVATAACHWNMLALISGVKMLSSAKPEMRRVACGCAGAELQMRAGSQKVGRYNARLIRLLAVAGVFKVKRVSAVERLLIKEKFRFKVIIFKDILKRRNYQFYA